MYTLQLVFEHITELYLTPLTLVTGNRLVQPLLMIMFLHVLVLTNIMIINPLYPANLTI